MIKSWSVAALGQLVRYRKEFIRIDELKAYKRCRVQLHAKGIVLRDEVLGTELKTKDQQVCRSGELLVAEIDAKVGGFGIVPEALDRAIVSSHYFLFTLDDKKIDQQFLDYYVRTPEFKDQVNAQGSTNYAAIRPNQVLEYKIPYPPLPEQRQIVAKIDELAAKIEEARTLHSRAQIEVEATYAAACRKVFDKEKWNYKTVGEIVGQEKLRNGKSVKEGNYSDGIRCLRLSAMQNGRLVLNDAKSVPLTRDEAREFLIRLGYVYVMRGNGSKELVGRAAMAEMSDDNTIFPDLFIRVPLEGSTWTPEFFVAYWNSPIMRTAIMDAAKTTSGIWKINQGHIASFRVPILPKDEQRRIVTYLDALRAKTEDLKGLHAETATEFDALLPSILDRAFKGEL